MVGHLHAVAELGDGPEGEESDDSDRKVEHVKHGTLPFSQLDQQHVTLRY